MIKKNYYEIRAFNSIKSDPQYIIINVADFYFLDWQANEEKWQNKVLPAAVKTVNEIKDKLGTGTDNRKLAWSTLLEYTDFAYDQPNSKSAYALQARRIMQVAQEADLPVFMPLNGFQWWNELPELWNYWDYDGNQTLGCENDRYDEIEAYIGDKPIYRCKFEELRNPKFREKFIAAYDPDNKWNVEWQNWTTPMKLNWRNWGGGGMQLAPPPNLVDHNRAKVSFVQMQTQRYEVIIDEIVKQLQIWQKKEKQYLFAGLTIGTEVSLNASIFPEDEFIPYGYRSIQDMFCSTDQPECGAEKKWSYSQLQQMRQNVVHEYLEDLAIRAYLKGIPQQRIYTHVWSEASPGEERYCNYFSAAFNEFSRPTLSLYGHAQNPWEFSLLFNELNNKHKPAWGAAEFSTDKDTESWQKAMKNTLNTPPISAQLIDIYNWREHKDTPALAVIQHELKKDQPNPFVSTVTSNQPLVQINPSELKWEILSDDQSDNQVISLYEYPCNFDQKPKYRYQIDDSILNWQVKSEVSTGSYCWQVSRGNKQVNLYRNLSPHIFVTTYDSDYTSSFQIIDQNISMLENFVTIVQVFTNPQSLN